MSKTVKRELVYWLLIFLWTAWDVVVNYISVFTIHFEPTKQFNAYFILAAVILFEYLLICFPYVSGRKMLQLPALGKKRAVLASVALTCLFPLWLIISVIFSTFFEMPNDPTFSTLEPLNSASFSLIMMALTLVLLRIIKLRPPKGKRLFVCFLPVLISALVGLALIHIFNTGFWINKYGLIGMTPERKLHWDWVYDYFSDMSVSIPPVTASVTVYEAVKCHHEQSEREYIH